MTPSTRNAADHFVPSATGSAAGTLRDFLIDLYRRHVRRAAVSARTIPEGVDRRLLALELAEAAVRLADRDVRPPQVAVFGPTQTGKSTLVNRLIGAELADVSPLAGHTVQAQGFAVGGAPVGPWSARLFPGFSRQARSELTPELLQTYSLEPAFGQSRLSEACVVWDTPDFDSLRSADYRRAVLECVALGDVLVLVVSKEKYADLTVWQMVDLVRPLDRGLVVCVNKLTPEAAEPIAAAVRQRLTTTRAGDSTQVVSLPQEPDAARRRADADDPASLDLINRVAGELRRATDHPRRPGVARLLREHWSAWLEPAAQESSAREQWRRQVQSGVSRAFDAYGRDYLDHPERFDTFRVATVELLRLLELPVVGGVLEKARNLVTWPLRTAVGAVRQWTSGEGGRGPRQLPEEQAVADAVSNLIIELERDASRRGRESSDDAPIWAVLADRLRSEESALKLRLAEATRRARDAFVPQIRAAATALHDALRQRPALLAGMRGLRATTDAASVLLAIKTGGVHVHDLVFAPAMFGLMSMLTEGALGAYMQSVEDELRRKQRRHMRERVFDDALTIALAELADDMNDARLFGLSDRSIREAEAALREWEAAGSDAGGHS